MRPLVLGAFLAAAGCEQPTAPVLQGQPPVAVPAPPAEPPAPAVPTGLRISEQGETFIEWAWTPVAEVTGYDVQFSANEAFTDKDEVIPRTAEQISYRREGLEAGTNAYLRVRAAAGGGENRVTSAWSTHVTGMTMAASAPTTKLFPCSGVTVYAESRPIVHYSGWRAVSLVLEIDNEEVSALNMDWGYPYYSGRSQSFGDGEVYTDTERLQVHVVSWTIVPEGSIVRHVLSVAWWSSFELRFRSRGGSCGDLAAVRCDEGGCSMST